MSFYDFIWKTIIWVGNRYDEKPICFGCGFELRTKDFELICQKGILVFSLLFLGVGKDEIFSETHLLDCVFGLGFAANYQNGTFFWEDVFLLRAK